MDILQQATDARIQFVLPEGRKELANGKPHIVNKRYIFDKDGILEVSAKDAMKLQAILCNYYGCKMRSVETTSVKTEETKTPEGTKTDSKSKEDSGSKQPVSSEAK